MTPALEILPGTVTQADPLLKHDMDSDFNILTFPPENYDQTLSNEATPIISFYVTMNQPYRVRVKPSDDPDEFAKKFFSFCH